MNMDLLSFGISVASLGASTIVVIFLLITWKKSITHRLLLCITTSDMLSMMFEVMTTIMTLNRSTCQALTALYVYFLQYACAWTCIIGFHIMWTARGRLPTVKLECIYVAVSVVVPLPYLLWLLLEGDVQLIYWGEIPECYFELNSPAIVIGWPLMRISFFVFNVVVLGSIILKVYQTKTWAPELKKSKSMTLLFIQICFLIYTVSSLIALGKDVSPLKVQISTFCTQSQGLMNSIVVGRKPVWRLLSKLRKRNTDSKRVLSQAECGTEMLQKANDEEYKTPVTEVAVGHATIVVSDHESISN